MKLINVEIMDFKSIKHEKIDINGNKLCFVGKNESGKSSIIQAISFLNFLDKEIPSNVLNKKSPLYPKGFPIIIGVFKISPLRYLQIISIIKENIVPLSHIAIPSESENSYIQIKRWGNGLANISVIMTDKENYTIDLTKEIDEKAKFFNDFFELVYPSIEYYENESFLVEPVSIDELLSNSNNHESFRRLLYIGGCTDIENLNTDDDNFLATFLSDIEDKFNETFKRHYKQDESINIKLQTIRGNKLSLIIKDKSRMSFSIDERSPGFKYYFSFLVNKLYVKIRTKNKNVIFLLDEPGASLHPKGTKDLLNTFDEIANGSQLLYTTHNPFLVIRNNLENLFFVEKHEFIGTKINKKPFLNKYQILRKELGILLNDSFLIGDLNLIVEGNTEKLALHRLFHFEKYRELEWLNIYNADGVANIPQALNYLGKNNLKLHGILLLDSDKEAENIKTSKAYVDNIKEKNWFSLEVNDVFKDKQIRTFEDLFPQELYIKAYNKYCKIVEKLNVFDKPFAVLEYKEKIATPIVDSVNAHFKSFIKPESKATITKQDVISHLLDDIEAMDEGNQEVHLLQISILLDKILENFRKIEKHANH